MDDDVIVEWRAHTVGFLDELLEEVNNLLGLSYCERISLPQMLEAGTWKVRSPFSEISALVKYLLKFFAGGAGDRGGIKTKYQTTSNYDPFRWDCLLTCAAILTFLFATFP